MKPRKTGKPLRPIDGKQLQIGSWEAGKDDRDRTEVNSPTEHLIYSRRKSRPNQRASPLIQGFSNKKKPTTAA